jgi:hypothetical protein
MPETNSAPSSDAAGRDGAPRAGFVLAAFVAAFLWDSIFAGRAFVMRDTVFDFLPWRRFAAQAALDGAAPLWNPFSRFGQPFLAEPQSGFFYPPHHLFDFLPVAAAFKATLALHLYVAAAGMFALLRRFGAAVEASLLAAVVFAFGGYFTANLEFMSVMDTLAWAPWTVLLACRVGDAWGGGARRIAGATLLLAVVLALQLFAGQVQVLAFSCVAAATYGVAVAVAEGRRAAAVAMIGGLAAAALVAVGVALVQVLPTLELVPHSIRDGGVDPGLDLASMTPRHLATLVFPFAFGRPGAGQFFSPTLFEFWLGCVHVGLAPLLAAFFAALAPKGRARALGAAAAASAALLVLGVLVAAGKYAPVYGWLQTLPGADFLRWPAKGLQLVAIALAVLAGLGFDAVLARRDAATGRIDGATLAFLGVVGALASALAVAAATDARAVARAFAGVELPPSLDASFVEGDVRRSAAFLVSGVLALAVAAFRPLPRSLGAGLVLVVSFANLHVLSREIQFVGDDTLLDAPPPDLPRAAASIDDGPLDSDYVFAGYHLYGSRDAAGYGAAAALLAGNFGVPHGIATTAGGDALLLKRADDLVKLLRALPDEPRARLADVLGISREIRGPPFAELLADPGAPLPVAASRPHAAPRAYVVDSWRAIEDSTDAVERMIAPDFDLRRQAIECPTPGVPALPPSPDAAPSSPGRVVALRRGWNRVEIDVEAARPCLLVLGETWMPGWTATVDGAPRPVARVNVLFRGVALSPGDRTVSMVYEPASFRRGAIGSCVATALLVAGFLWSRCSARREGPPIPSMP